MYTHVHESTRTRAHASAYTRIRFRPFFRPLTSLHAQPMNGSSSLVSTQWHRMNRGKLTWKSFVLAIGTDAALHAWPLFPDNDQITDSAVEMFPAEYFIRTFSVPILAPYMWYQKRRHRLVFVIGNRSLIYLALSPGILGEEDSMYAYVPMIKENTVLQF